MSSNTLAGQASTVHIPAERCYWAVIEAPGVRVRGPLPDALRDEVAADIPVDAGRLWIVTAPAGDGLLVACAVARDEVERLAERALRATPSAVPGAVGVGVRAEDFNVLVGEHEPHATLKARRNRHARWMGTVLCVSALLGLGLARRAAWHEQRSAAAQVTVEALLAAASRDHAPGDEAFLVQEIEGLRRRLANARLPDAPRDASVPMARMLRMWPRDIPAVAQSLGASGGTVTAFVSVDQADAARFVDGLRAPDGWVMNEPRTGAGPGGARITVSMKRALIPEER